MGRSQLLVFLGIILIMSNTFMCFAKPQAYVLDQEYTAGTANRLFSPGSTWWQSFTPSQSNVARFTIFYFENGYGAGQITFYLSTDSTIGSDLGSGTVSYSFFGVGPLTCTLDGGAKIVTPNEEYYMIFNHLSGGSSELLIECSKSSDSTHYSGGRADFDVAEDYDFQERYDDTISEFNPRTALISIFIVSIVVMFVKKKRNQ